MSEILDFIEKNGLGQGLLVILILGLMYVIYVRQKSLQDKILSSKDDEIKRLVEDNKNLRNMFTSLVKDKLDIKDDELELKSKEEVELKNVEKHKKQ